MIGQSTITPTGPHGAPTRAGRGFGVGRILDVGEAGPPEAGV